MLALARALSREPKLLLADELSLGLAPKIVDRLLGAVRDAADTSGTGALIVEQHARKALRFSDRMYLMARGQILLELSAEEALGRLDEIEEAYLRGTSETEEDHIERKRRKDKRAWRRQESESVNSPASAAELFRLEALMTTITTDAEQHGANGHSKLENLAMATAQLNYCQSRSTSSSESFFQRMKLLQLHWVEQGFGTPKQTSTSTEDLFHGLFGLIIAGAFTAGLNSTTLASGGTNRSFTRSQWCGRSYWRSSA